jgi:hypothetical protein
MPPRSSRCWKESPPKTMGRMKKLEWSDVWVAHCSFVSGRPNETACGFHTASFASGRSNEAACGLHAASLASGTTLQGGGGTNALLLPAVSPFSLLPPRSSPSYSLFCPPRSLGLRDVAVRRRALFVASRDTGGCCWLWMTWRSSVARRGCWWWWVTCWMSLAHIPR